METQKQKCSHCGGDHLAQMCPKRHRAGLVAHQTILDACGSHGCALITRERHHQLLHTAYTPQHDDKHDRGELIRAGETVAAVAKVKATGRDVFKEIWPSWPWSDEDLQDILKRTVPDLLAIAGAFFAAEIDRIYRKERRAGWQVFAVSAEFWWLARTAAEARADALREEQVQEDDLNEFGPPIALGDVAMDKLRFISGGEIGEISFREEFERRLAGGPCVEVFATTEY